MTPIASRSKRLGGGFSSTSPSRLRGAAPPSLEHHVVFPRSLGATGALSRCSHGHCRAARGMGWVRHGRHSLTCRPTSAKPQEAGGSGAKARLLGLADIFVGDTLTQVAGHGGIASRLPCRERVLCQRIFRGDHR